PLSRGRAALLAAAVLAAVLALGSLGLQAAPSETAPPAPPAPAAPAFPGAGAALEGKLVDRARPGVAGAKVCALCRSGACAVNATKPVTTDGKGMFRLDQAPDGAIVAGKVLTLRVVTAGGHSYEMNVAAAAGVVTVRLPTVLGAKVRP